MRRLLPALIFGAFAFQGQAQTANLDSELASVLSFETTHSGAMPQGWGGGPPETIFVDGEIVHGGKWAARLQRNSNSPNGFSTITKVIPLDFSGTNVEWRGFLRTEDVSDFTGLWMREDGDAGPLAFDNMQQRQVKGTHGWTEYSITLPLRREARQIFFGVLVAGTGKVWADDLQLLVDGKPVWDAPRLVDEVSQSQAEYTAMAFRSTPRSIVVGSATAGADGNVSTIVLPGGLSTMISGIGVFYPDKKPTQRVGIVPDVEVKPTIAGIRAGRDEVLEEALRQILGRLIPQDQIEKMAKP